MYEIHSSQQFALVDYKDLDWLGDLDAVATEQVDAIDADLGGDTEVQLLVPCPDDAWRPETTDPT